MKTEAVLQEILAELAGPVLLIGKDKRVLLANERFRELTGLAVDSLPCDAFLAPALSSAKGKCCWDVADRYLALGEPGLWHVRDRQGVHRPVLCDLQEIRIGSRSAIIAVTLHPLTESQSATDLAERYFSGMRRSQPSATAFMSWCAAYLRQQFGFKRVIWVEQLDGAPGPSSHGSEKTTVAIRAAFGQLHPAARRSGMFDVLVDTNRRTKASQMIHVFHAAGGASPTALAACGGHLDSVALGALRAALRCVVRPIDQHARLGQGALPLAAFEALSPAEREVLTLTCAGCGDKEIAQQRQVSLNTVRNQVRSLMQKLGVRKRTQLVALALRSSVAETAA